MEIIKNTGREKIKSAIHIADIHIRLTQRHDEYQEVFENLYKELKKVTKKESTILFIVGDIFHNKSDLSPECIDVASKFLKSCADILPTIVTGGNHDATLSNKNRMDSLTPIIDSLEHDNLYYLYKSGVYRYENLLINNYSIFDDPTSDYIAHKNIKSTHRLATDHHIVLFHGAMNNAITDIGYVIENKTALPSMFDGHHIAMLGDIHKHQVLQEYNEGKQLPIIAYVGSLIQQNHGENLLGHGFLLWNLENRTFKHHELKNKHGYYTADVENGKLISNVVELPSKVRLRIRSKNTVPSQLNEVVDKLCNSYDVLETTYQKIESVDEHSIVSGKDFSNVETLADVEYQNKLIEKFLNSKNTDKVLIENIKKINLEFNKSLPSEVLSRNIRWKPKTFEFDNMFSYGEGNVIDFSKLSGTVGLFAENTAGKSSIMDCLSFCLFDKYSKGFKAAEIINIDKTSFRCKFNFEIDGENYFVERVGTKSKSGSVKVSVEFWKEDSSNNIINLNGEARRNTNDNIREYVGTYDNFLLTVLCVQHKNMSFIDLGHSDRKDLLCQFMGLDIFEKLHVAGNERYKEIHVKLKDISVDELNTECSKTKSLISVTKDEIKKSKIEVEKLELKKDSISNDVIELSNKIINKEVDITDISNLELQKKQITNEIRNLNKSKEEKEIVFESREKEMKKINSKFTITRESKEYKKIESSYKQYTTLLKKEHAKKIEIEKHKFIVKTKLDKLSKLEKHEYDPNCKFCVNNVFVKDALATNKSLEDDKLKVKVIMEDYNNIKNDVKVCKESEKKYNDLNLKIDYVTKLKTEISKLENEILSFDNSIMRYNSKLENINAAIKTFYENKDIISNNKKLLNDISEKKSQIKSLDLEIKNNNTLIFDKNSKLGEFSTKYKYLLDKLDETKKLELDYNSYKTYTHIMGRDGIPYEMIKQTLPAIEFQINEILNQIVNFNINLDTDGKNISANIVYADRQWTVEMSSGFERFVLGLAIRVALIQISNLPRPNMLCIDEGFGCADNNNLGQMEILFSNLQHKFDFIWIISHLDKMRDMVDNKLEITKENGFSNVKYN